MTSHLEPGASGEICSAPRADLRHQLITCTWLVGWLAGWLSVPPVYEAGRRMSWSRLGGRQQCVRCGTRLWWRTIPEDNPLSHGCVFLVDFVIWFFIPLLCQTYLAAWDIARLIDTLGTKTTLINEDCPCISVLHTAREVMIFTWLCSQETAQSSLPGPQQHTSSLKFSTIQRLWHNTYDHRCWETRGHVRSPADKPVVARLVQSLNKSVVAFPKFDAIKYSSEIKYKIKFCIFEKFIHNT